MAESALVVGLKEVVLLADRVDVAWEAAGHPADRSHQGPSAEDRDAVALRVLVSQSSSFLEEHEKEYASAHYERWWNAFFFSGFARAHELPAMRKRRPA